MAMGGPRIWWVVCLSLMLWLLAMCPQLTKSFLSLYPDPQEGVSVGCIDFSLMHESGVPGKAARRKRKGKKRGKGELR